MTGVLMSWLQNCVICAWKRWKPGIERLVGISDIVVYENESELPEIAKTKRLFCGDGHGIKGGQDFFELVSDLIYERKTERRNNETDY